MELIKELANNQLVVFIPVALVLIVAVLVFTFGFKSAEQPPFKLSSANDERKAAGKKKKIKDKVYRDVVRLVLRVFPTVFASSSFPY